MIVFRLLYKLVVLPFRVGAGSARVGWKAGRLVGPSRALTFGAGVATGVLIVSPRARRALFAALSGGRAAILRAQQPSDGELTVAVTDQLRTAQRTWHLPQPAVEVSGGAVVLRGEVPNEVARLDLAATAADVPGVVDVDNQLEVTTGEAG